MREGLPMTTISGPAGVKSLSDTSSAAPARPVTKVTPVPIPKPGPLSSLAPSGSRSSTNAKPSLNNGSAATTAPSTGFGLLAPADTNLQDAANGPHRDGRIRNPVPSKLKGKTDGSKGNFSVMHLEVSGRSEATERDAQAKRTSESTELAAKRAFENGYVSLRRSRFVHIPDETAAKPFVPTPISVQVSNPSSRQSPLSPEETKAEQARLLTLLRSLHPVLIVDQICKALAFFGGIPGAPPPADGLFPQSAEANGSGSLFVGWVSEIFPKLGGNIGQQALSPATQLDAPEVTKRRRGRPKGSKATKARKDKGVKKGSNKPGSTADQVPSAEVDESWVDIDESVMGVSDDVDANVMLLAQAASPHRLPIPIMRQETPQVATDTGQPNQAASGSTRTALPGAPNGLDVIIDNASSVRKRGRPKGSKNRPKDSSVPSSDNRGSTPQASQGTRLGQASAPAPIQQDYQPPPERESYPSPAVINSTAPAQNKKKSNKSKSSAMNQKTAEQSNGPAQPALNLEALNISSSTPAEPPLASGKQPVNQSSSHFGQHHAYQQNQEFQASQAQGLQTPTTTALDKAKASGNTGQKRKRKGGKDAENSAANSQGQGNDLASSGTTGLAMLSSSGNVPTSRSQVPLPAVGPPPAKRQRKAKGDSKSAGKKQNEYTAASATAISSTVPASVTSTVIVPPPIPVSTSNPLPVSTSTTGRGPEPISTPAPPSVEQTMPSVHSPHHGHFEVQSPTMENYEAQLQAQLEQQAEPEPQPSPQPPTQGRLGTARLMSSHLQQQQYQQRQQHQQNHGQQASATQSRSPNPPPPQSMKSQTASPIPTSQQTRTPQSSYSQYRPSSTSFGQQHQQSYGSTQQQQGQQQRFTGQQQAAQVTTQTAQPQQYSSNTQQPFSTTQQYSSSHQQLAPQQRYQQQLATSSAGTTTYAAQHSPQFGSSTSNTFGTTDGSYRSSATNLSTTAYASQRSQSGTPTTSATYRAGSANSAHSLPHHSPSFGTDTGAPQRRSTSTAHTASQSIHSMASVQPFSGNNSNEWGLFDASSLDSSGNQNSMSLNNGNYGINSATVRAPSNSTPGFSSSALGNFDASGLGSNDRFYGVGRR